ncbi:MAG: V-type ATPase subunit [Gemmatimonadetes bacterium]|nr:V-type ATPase subunit [Gemmatimonadota bacterium]
MDRGGGVYWGDLNARARGLSSRLLGRARLEELLGGPDASLLARDVAEIVGPAGETRGAGAPGAAALAEAIRARAGRRLSVLELWAGSRSRALCVLLEDEDRRSLRALLRGAVADAPAAARLRGTMPTPRLPERMLRDLAAAPTAAALVALLVSEEHPYGWPLLPLAAGMRPDLFRIELALDHTFAARALAGARAGGRALLAHVRTIVDLDNAFTALLLRGPVADVEPDECFLPGGARLGRDRFVMATSAEDDAEAGRVLAAAFAGTGYASLFREVGDQGAIGDRAPRLTSLVGWPERLEDAALSVQISEALRMARRDPLGPAPLIAYMLRLRAEVRDLRRIVWGFALGAPSSTVAAGLVTDR